MPQFDKDAALDIIRNGTEALYWGDGEDYENDSSANWKRLDEVLPKR